MRKIYLVILTVILSFSQVSGQQEIADPAYYLSKVKSALQQEWPNNRTINLVFHGHSVPAGYFKTPVVNTLESYPYQLLVALKNKYPHAVINIINTSIGGENSVQGQRRFESEVLAHSPDVLFIDYALNDRRAGLDDAHTAWSSMIEQALKQDIKIILLTPSPDQRVNILDGNSDLDQHANQIIELSKDHELGLVDSYRLFKNKVIAGDSVSTYMSQVNHPNGAGHQLITKGLMRYFE